MFNPSRSNIFLAVATVVTVLLWAGFEVYRTYHTSTISPETAQTISPLDTFVDEAILDDLAKRSGSEEAP